MAQFSFDVVSDYDKGEMNNVFDQTQREITARYDFKGTSAAIEWLDGDKNGLKITGDNQFHIDSILDIVRKKLATRGLSQKVLDTSEEATTTNMKMTQVVKFKQGLDQDKAKNLSKVIRDSGAKVKSQIQGDSVRVMSASKDDLQEIMQILRQQELDYPISFNNFR